MTFNQSRYIEGSIGMLSTYMYHNTVYGEYVWKLECGWSKHLVAFDVDDCVC